MGISFTHPNEYSQYIATNSMNFLWFHCFTSIRSSFTTQWRLGPSQVYIVMVRDDAGGQAAAERIFEVRMADGGSGNGVPTTAILYNLYVCIYTYIYICVRDIYVYIYIYAIYIYTYTNLSVCLSVCLSILEKLGSSWLHFDRLNPRHWFDICRWLGMCAAGNSAFLLGKGAGPVTEMAPGSAWKFSSNGTSERGSKD